MNNYVFNWIIKCFHAVAFKDVAGDILERNLLFTDNICPACQMSLLFVFNNGSSVSIAKANLDESFVYLCMSFC